MDNKNFAIGTLSVTAVVLLMALIILAQFPAQHPAFGFAQTAVGGDYIMFGGQIEESNELIYVIDIAVRQMNVYAANPSKRELLLVQRIDLQRLPKVGEGKRKQSRRRY